jgi:hypothetical protein
MVADQDGPAAAFGVDQLEGRRLVVGDPSLPIAPSARHIGYPQKQLA